MLSINVHGLGIYAVLLPKPASWPAAFNSSFILNPKFLYHAAQIMETKNIPGIRKALVSNIEES
jgi:hypothetical protein